MPNETTCLDPETVAALAEGQLVGGERDAAVAHLARCAECRELLAEVAAVLEGVESAGSNEHAAASGRSKRTTGPWRHGVTPLPFLVAAAALLLVAAVVAWQAMMRPSLPARADLLVDLPHSASHLVEQRWETSVMRGPAEDRLLQRQSVELGVLLVDLELASRLGHEDAASLVLARIGEVASHAGLLDHEVGELRRLAANGTHVEIASQLPALEDVLRKRFFDEYVDLGSLLEATRLAALAGTPGPMDKRASQRYLRWMLAAEGDHLPQSARHQLSELQAARSPAARAAAAEKVLRALM